MLVLLSNCFLSYNIPRKFRKFRKFTSDFDSSFPENITQIIETEKSENHEKDALVKNLTSVGAELTNSLATGDQELIQNLLTEFKQVWFQITDKSSEWHGDESQDLRIYTAKILFLAKYVICIFILFKRNLIINPFV